MQILLAQTTTTTEDDGNPLDFVGDFFDSEAWLVIRNVTLFFLVVFWLASRTGCTRTPGAGSRTLAPGDGRRARDLSAFIGPLIYMLFRPPEYLEDVRERELEIKAMEENLDSVERCPVCRAAIEANFLACPVCTTKLKDSCRRCKAPLEPLWQICPFCETPVESPRAVENLSG